MNTQAVGRLNERAVRVTLSLSRWEGVVKNRKVSASVEVEHGAARDSTKLLQKLLPGCESHENLLSMFGALRNWHYERTLPWEDRGPRLLGAAGVVGYMAEFRRMRTEIEEALDKFCADYPTEQIKAQVRLGDLYNPTHYPDVKTVRGLFGVRLSVSPLPDGEDLRNFVGFTPGELQAAIAEHETATRDRLYGAMKDAVTRLHEPLKAMAERLSDPEAVFRDTLVGNLATVVSLMPSLNIMGDPRVDALCASAKDLIHQPETLRADPELRNETALKAAALARELEGFTL